MAPTTHFISGLPRAGSTLLAALLRQNPAISASVTSPVYSLCTSLKREMGVESEFSSMYTDTRRHAIISSVFRAYYADSRASLILDTNRLWTASLELIDALFPQAKVICCVREVAWIIDSVERALQSVPLAQTRLIESSAATTLYARVAALMNSESGLVGLPWSCLRQAWFGNYAHKLVVIPYNTLVSKPRQTLSALYERLGERYFDHDFKNVQFTSPDYDASLGVRGLHTVLPEVRHTPRVASIPPDIFSNYASCDFWQNTQLNIRKVDIL